MKHLVLCLAALGIGCATSKPVEVRAAAARPAPHPAIASPTRSPVEAAAEFALRTYVDESTRAHGVVCVELDGDEDAGKVLEHLAPLAGYLSVDRSTCLDRDGPSAILSIGRSQVAGARARVDVGVVLGSGGMLELELREDTWLVVRATSPWLSLR